MCCHIWQRAHDEEDEKEREKAEGLRERESLEDGLNESTLQPKS